MAPRQTLLGVLRDRIQAKHYSARTEEAYSMWVRRYVRYYRGRHPRELGCLHVRDFLTHLARDGGVAASTQNQALAALLFLYGSVLDMPMAATLDHVHAKRPLRLPVVLTRDEVERLLAQLEGTARLMAQVMYGGDVRRWVTADGVPLPAREGY